MESLDGWVSGGLLDPGLGTVGSGATMSSILRAELPDVVVVVPLPFRGESTRIDKWRELRE